MTDMDKKIQALEKKVEKLMASPSEQASVKRSVIKVTASVDRLNRASQVDPKLLDEPATI